MPDIFDDTIESVREQKNAAAAGAPPEANSEVSASEGQGAEAADASTPTQPPDRTAESPETAGEGAREGGGEAEAQATTSTEDQQSTFDKLTGLESEADLRSRHGDNFAAAFTRRFQPVIREAGGMPMLRHGAQIVSAINDPKTDAEAFSRLVSAVSPSRWAELKGEIVGRELSADLPAEEFNARVREAAPFIWRAVEENPSVVLQGLLQDEAVTLDEVRQALADHRYWAGRDQGGEGGQGQQQPADELANLPPALRKEIEESRQLRQRFPEIERELSTFRTERQTRAEEARKQQVNELGQELYQSVFSVVAERRNKLGLEAKPSDTPRVRGIKAALNKALSDEALEAAFEADADRKALSERALHKVDRLERDGAFAFRDPLAVMAEMTFQEVVESEEVKSLLDALKSELQAQSTPRDPSARPEMVAGAPAAPKPSDAWQNIPADVDPFDFGVGLARERSKAAR